MSSCCKDVCSLWPPTVPLCQTWSVNWSTTMDYAELTFCEGWTCLVETETAGQPFLRFPVQVGQNASLSWPATVGRAWHKSVKLFFAKIGTFQHSQKGPPNRTFAAEESRQTAYKLIELCSLSRRNVITTWCVKHWEKLASRTRVQTAPFLAKCEFSCEAGMERQM